MLLTKGSCTSLFLLVSAQGSEVPQGLSAVSLLLVSALALPQSSGMGKAAQVLAVTDELSTAPLDSPHGLPLSTATEPSAAAPLKNESLLKSSSLSHRLAAVLVSVRGIAVSTLFTSALELGAGVATGSLEVADRLSEVAGMLEEVEERMLDAGDDFD